MTGIAIHCLSCQHIHITLACTAARMILRWAAARLEAPRSWAIWVYIKVSTICMNEGSSSLTIASLSASSGSTFACDTSFPCFASASALSCISLMECCEGRSVFDILYLYARLIDRWEDDDGWLRWSTEVCTRRLYYEIYEDQIASVHKALWAVGGIAIDCTSCQHIDLPLACTTTSSTSGSDKESWGLIVLPVGGCLAEPAFGGWKREKMRSRCPGIYG